jgi:hypothetical protein
MKKIAALAVVFLMLTMPVMAGVTVATPDTGKTSQGGSFIVNAYTANGSGCEELKAAPGAGTAIYIRSLAITSATPITVTIGEGETTAGSADTTLIGPVTFGTNAANLEWDFYPALKLTNNKSLVVDTSATGDVVIVIQGFVE